MPEDMADPRKAELRRLVERAETVEQELDDVLRARAHTGSSPGCWTRRTSALGTPLRCGRPGTG